MNDILLFDGECNLCNGAVQFIIDRDPKGHFKFAALQSKVGSELLQTYDLPKSFNSIVLIQNAKVYQQSSAALRICRKLKGFWKLLTVLLIIPRPLRDALYNYVAKNRYKWFGKRNECMMPTPDIKKRFLQ
ncbi:thiol-disulfide oxidoreductase DCC family protein [Pseudalkalibacillus berkeleyi]|uniref:Thiol-disulfide oxidoreductase DCC family protein n=1 Tax=Pseudalkalibacillus berkeleyi TaxID=1069813 RepID=A0ABS9H156_9BACL|nr:thiol-disulfide oxidoreductase DCC family protein [Pseudalkalibacillus berkeleyi]MCF6138739.1 thiol-disulfide oxidoreductase DCC family protein [Pseudalkalibacillus berkeleyi]